MVDLLFSIVVWSCMVNLWFTLKSPWLGRSVQNVEGVDALWSLSVQRRRKDSVTFFNNASGHLIWFLGGQFWRLSTGYLTHKIYDTKCNVTGRLPVVAEYTVYKGLFFSFFSSSFLIHRTTDSTSSESVLQNCKVLQEFGTRRYLLRLSDPGNIHRLKGTWAWP